MWLEDLHEPPQRLALDNIERAPSQVRGNQIAIGLFAFIFDRHDEPFGFVGTDVQSRTADQGDDPCTPTDADGVRGPGMGGKIVCHRLLAFMHADFLIAADLRDDLHATEQRRGPIDKGRRAIEGIRRDTVTLKAGCWVLNWASKRRASACLVG